MSERILRAIAALIVACLALAPVAPLCAQSQGPSHAGEEAALLRHLDTILPAFKEALREQRAVQARQDAAALARAAARVRGLLDTISVGPLRIVTPRGQERAARELFADAWGGYEPQVHDSPALAHTLFTFQWALKSETIPARGDVERVRMPLWETRGSVEDAIGQAVGTALAADLSTTRTGRTWLNVPVRPVADPADVYRALAATPAKVNRSCLEGDADACAQALGLEVKPGSWRSWFTPQERRDQVRAEFSPFAGPYHALRTACVDGSDGACDELLGVAYSRSWRTQTPGTLPDYGRQSLLWFALQRGGAGAWARLLKDPEAPPEQALAAASGLGVNQLVAAWRGWVLEQRPDVAAGLSGGMLATGLWILLFAALGMRSTRWRLG